MLLDFSFLLCCRCLCRRIIIIIIVCFVQKLPAADAVE